MNHKQQSVTSQTRPGDGKSEKNGRLNDASIAGEQCHQGETDGGITVTRLANRQPIEPGKRPQNEQDVTFATSRSNAGGERNAAVTVGICGQCGGEMLVKRASKKYCSDRCRHLAWLERHPDIVEQRNAQYRKWLRGRIEEAGGVWVELDPAG